MKDQDVRHISTPTYDSYVTHLPDELTFMERHHIHAQANVQVDTFASLWFVGVANLSPGQLAIRDGAAVKTYSGPIGIFVPPFSLVEWHLGAGAMTWKSYASGRPLPAGLPTGPSTFVWDGQQPSDMSSLLAWLARSPMRQLTSERVVSQLAQRTKLYIDQNFTDDLKICEVAEALGVSRVVMTREFKRCYGISPVIYRHKLRLFEAMLLMSKGANVTTATFAVGFSSSMRFIHHFKDYLGTTPREYALRRSRNSDVCTHEGILPDRL